MKELKQAAVTDEEFEKIVDMMPMAALIHRAGVIAYANTEAGHLFGYDTPDELIGQNMLDFTIGEDRLKLLDILKKSALEPVRHEVAFVRIRNAKNELVETETKASTIHYKGAEYRLVLAYHVIGKLAKELQEKNLLIRKITDLIPDHLMVVESLSRKVLFENKPLLETLGYTADDLKDKDQFQFIASIVHKDDIPLLVESRNFLTDAKNSGKYITTVYRLKDKSGEWRWIQGRSTVLKYGNENAQPIHFGIAQDITALKTSEDRTKAILMALPDMVFQFEPATGVISDVYFNRAFLGVLSEVHFKGKQAREFLRQADFKQVTELSFDAIQTNELRYHEYTYRHLDTDYHYEFRIVRLNDAEAIVMLRDITDLRVMQLRLNQNLAELSEKNLELEKYITSNTELERFAYIASHDLREPVRSIIGFAQLIQKRQQDKLDAETNEFLHNIIQSGQRMYLLILGLLDYSRISSEGKEFAPVRLQDVLEKVRSDIRASIEESEAVIEYDELPIIRCDELQIRQLLQNLISNSIKFKKADAAPVIRIAVQKDENNWLFSVTDNGIGMEMKYRSKVFQLFSRLNTSDKYQGSGIGLALCKRIVERHGGAIWMESFPGEGSTFYFTLTQSD